MFNLYSSPLGMIFQCKLHESHIYHKQGFLADQSCEDQCIKQSGIIYMGIDPTESKAYIRGSQKFSGPLERL